MRQTILRCIAAVAVAVAALVAVTSVRATGRYVDPTGDAGPGAPDIGTVLVTSDAGGQIVFTIGVTPAPQTEDSYVFICLDTDLNIGTGDPMLDGADYAVEVDPEGIYFGRWIGADWVEASQAAVRVTRTPDSLGISVNRRQLGNTNGFTFWLGSGVGDASNALTDIAPNETQWNYSLATKAPDVRAVMLAATPSLPRVGRSFNVEPVGLQLPDTGEMVMVRPVPDSYSCEARLAGKAIRGHGVGGCTWQLPKAARGKKLAVFVTVSYEGAIARFPFLFPVAR